MAIDDNSAYGLTGAQVKEIASKIDSKQGTLTAGTNVQISADNEISATDTTYSAFTGTDGQTAGSAGLVPAPATTDAGKFLNADGDWEKVDTRSIKVLTTADFNANYNDWTDTNPANFNCIALWKLPDGIYEPQKESAQSQDFRIYSDNNNYSDTSSISTTRQDIFVVARMLPANYPSTIIIFHEGYMIWKTINVNPSGTTVTVSRTEHSASYRDLYYTDNSGNSNPGRVAISGVSDGAYSTSVGSGSRAGSYGTAIGYGAQASGASNCIALGNSTASGNEAISMGKDSTASGDSSVALGCYSSATQRGQFDISTGGRTTSGYNGSAYRLLTGLYDPQSDHDAATKGYVDDKVLSNAGTPTTATVGTVGQLLEDTTNGKLYQCTEIDDSTTPIVYTWREMATLEQVSWRQRKPIVVWEVDGTVVTTGLVGVGEDISATPNWQLTDLDLTPYKRIKIFTKAAQKAGSTASASTTPAMVLEMSLDPRAAIAEYGGNYVGSMIAQKPNDANRLCTLTCAVSADKTKFEVLRMTNLYGTAATSNSDVNGYVFKIEGYYD